MKTLIPSLVIVGTSCLATIAAGQTHTGNNTSGVHCDHFSKTGDTAYYNSATGQPIANYKGYSGQPLYQNKPSTAAVRNAGTIPSGFIIFTHCGIARGGCAGDD